MYTYSMLALDEKTFSKMAEADQTIVRDVMNRVFTKIDAANRADNEKAYAALLGQDIEKVNPDLTGLDSWRRQADQTIADLVSGDELSQQSVDDLRRNLGEFRTSASETETGQ
jgi:TRAP-type C4-dicarboxylate transport system substrate-binding protein